MKIKLTILLTVFCLFAFADAVSAQKKKPRKRITQIRVDVPPPRMAIIQRIDAPLPVETEASWKEFVSSEGEFKITSPGTLLKVSNGGSEQAKKQHQVAYSLRTASAEYNVIHINLSYVVDDTVWLKNFYDYMLDFMNKNPSYKILETRETTVGKYAGREMSFLQMPQKRYSKVKAFLVGRRYYLIFFGAKPVVTDEAKPLSNTDRDRMERFFASFQPTSGAPSVVELEAQPQPAGFAGKTVDGVYQNEFFGFTIKPPTDWNALNRDEEGAAREMGKTLVQNGDAKHNERISRATDKVRFLTVVTKKAFGLPENAALMIIADKIRFPEMSVRELAELNLESLTTDLKEKQRVISALSEVELNGVKFAVCEIELQIPGAKQKQRMFFTRKNNYLLLFNLAYSSDGDLPELEKALQTLKFEAEK